MARYQCIDCPQLDTEDASEAKHHAEFNNHCVVDDTDEDYEDDAESIAAWGLVEQEAQLDALESSYGIEPRGWQDSY